MEKTGSPYIALTGLGGDGGNGDDAQSVCEGDDVPLLAPTTKTPAPRRRLPRGAVVGVVCAAVALTGVLALVLAWMWSPLHRQCDRSVRPRTNRTFRALSFNQSELTIFDISIIGAHNAYHRASWVPFVAQWAYTNPSLTALLDDGVMSLDLDLHYVGGVWYVYHLPIIDPFSTATCLTDALEEIAAWSDQHPGYPPIRISFEPKYVIDYNNFCAHGPTDTLFSELQELIVHVLGPGRVVLPSELQGNFSSLLEAVQTRGWPTLETLRGRMLLSIDLHAENKDCAPLFRRIPSADRIMLVEYDFREIRHDQPPDGIFANIDCCDPWLTKNFEVIIAQNVLVSELAALSGRDYGTELVWIGLHTGFHVITTDNSMRRTARDLNHIPEVKAAWMRCNAFTTSPVPLAGKKTCDQDDLIALFGLPSFRPKNLTSRA